MSAEHVAPLKEGVYYYVYSTIYGGTSWAAMRLPDDRAAVIGTLIMLEWVNPDDPGDDWYVSPNLKSLLDGMPIPVIRKDGCYNIAETLTPGKRETLYTMRIWRLQQRLCPSSVGPFDENFHYPLLLEPEEKVTVLEVMKLLGDRFEGTAYDMELLDWADRRTRFPAGDSNQSSAHIVQTFSDLPDRCCQLQWLAMANAEYSVFVPAFSGITDTFELYKTDPEEDKLVDDSYYYLSKKIWGLAASDRARLGEGVSSFQRSQEKALLAQMLKETDLIREQYRISDAEGDRYVTELSMRTAREQYTCQARLFRCLFYHQISNCDEYLKERIAFCMEKQK